MKKILTTLLAVSMMLVGTTAFAQASIGMGFVNSTNIIDGAKDLNANGFNVFANYNFSLGGGFGVAPGLSYVYVTKNDAKLTGLSELGELKGDLNEMYINIPVMFNYGFQLGDGLVGRIFAGPTLSFDVMDKFKDIKISSSLASLSSGMDINLLDNDLNQEVKTFDLMLGGGFALDCYDIVRFKVGYDYGLIDRWDGNLDLNLNRGQFYFSVAYLF